MTEIPKISIVIACYNDPYVVEAVESAYLQSYPNKEIIVIDDGSKEEIKEALRSLKNQISILIEQENSGQSIARNNGIKRATGKYVLNLDSDDFFEDSFCEKAVRTFEEEEKVKIVTCNARRFNEKGTIDIFIPRGGEIGNFLYSNAALGSSMFRKSSWEKSGGYEEKLPILGIEDWEFYIQILKDGGYAYVIPEVLFHYRVRPNSTTSRIRNSRHEKFKHIIIKHQQLYGDTNFGSTIDHLIAQINKLQLEKEKVFNTADFRIGRTLLQPLRIFKRILKNK